MQQRLCFRGCIKISHLAPRQQIRKKQRSGEPVPSQTLIGRRQELRPSDRQRGGDNNSQCRKNPSGAPCIEAGETEIGRSLVRQNDPGDQIAADYKEDVNADEPPAYDGRERMKRDNQHDCDSAKTIDIGTIIEVHINRGSYFPFWVKRGQAIRRIGDTAIFPFK
jgi:hypothetical protein